MNRHTTLSCTQKNFPEAIDWMRAAAHREFSMATQLTMSITKTYPTDHGVNGLFNWTVEISGEVIEETSAE